MDHNLTPEQRRLLKEIKRDAGSPMAKAWLLPQDTREQFMVFDVLLPAGKKLVVGYGLGSMDGNGELLLTDIAQKVLERGCRRGCGGNRLVA